jgi:transposase
MNTLGIDISKADFHAVLLQGEHGARRSFPYSDKGFAQLDAWLRNRDAGEVYACMEATGAYWRALATYLFDAGHHVAVVNPRRIKSFAESELARSKTDGIDAAIIARFAQTQKPRLWRPEAPEVLELQALCRHLEFLKTSRGQHVTRAQTPGLPSLVLASAQKVIAELDAQIAELQRMIKSHIDAHPALKAQKKLLVTIPGIGDATAAVILSEMPNITEFRSSQAVAAYAGLSPRLRQSGSSVRGKTVLCKTGNWRVRKAFFLPAMVAQRHNPTLRNVAARLLAAGKSPMSVVGALMRKLLVLAYGVLKSQRPYDPTFGTQTA